MTANTPAPAIGARVQTASVSDGVRAAARIGYAAVGVVYLVIGGLALAAAFGAGGQTTGSKGAIAVMSNQPWGDALLWVVAIGLVGFVIWRMLQGFADADRQGTDKKAIARRAGNVASGIAYATLAFYALSLIFGWNRWQSSGGGGAQSWTAWLMAQPLGRWLVGIVGLVVVVVGVVQIARAVKASFERKLRVGPRHLRWVRPIGRAGLTARGLVFGIIGIALIVAGVQADPSEARGLDGALETLQRQAYGQWLLGVIAVGLIAFAGFSFVRAWARRVPAGG